MFFTFAIVGKRHFVTGFLRLNQTLQLRGVENNLVVKLGDHIISFEAGLFCRAIFGHVTHAHTYAGGDV